MTTRSATVTTATRALARTLIATSLVAASLAWLATRPRADLVPVRTTEVPLDEPWEDAGAMPVDH